MLVEVAVLVAAVRWLDVYFFHLPHYAPDDPTVMHGGPEALFPEAEMPFRILQIALSLLVGVTALEAVAGRERGRRRLLPLLPAAALFAIMLCVLDLDGTYTFYTLLESLTQRMQGSLAASVADVNNAFLRNRLIWVLSWTVVRLATYAIVYLYVLRAAARRETSAAET